MTEQTKNTFRSWSLWFSKFSIPEINRFGTRISGKLPIGGRKLEAAATLILYPKHFRTTDEVAKEVEVSAPVFRNWKSEERFQILVKSLEHHFAAYFFDSLLDWEMISLLYKNKTEPFLWNNSVLRILIYNLAKILTPYLESKNMREREKRKVLLLRALGLSKLEPLDIEISVDTIKKAYFFDPMNIIAAREALQLLVRAFEGEWGGEDERPEDSSFLDEALKNFFVDLGAEMEENLALLKKAYQSNLSKEKVMEVHNNCERLGVIASRKISFLEYNTKLKAGIRNKRKGGKQNELRKEGKISF